MAKPLDQNSYLRRILFYADLFCNRNPVPVSVHDHCGEPLGYRVYRSLDSELNLFNTAHLGKCSILHTSANSGVNMGRELVWLENSTFAAWGCSTCAWIVPNPGATVSGKPPTSVKDTFDKHDCAKFPRAPQSR